ncbi:PDZ domain-containing protein [Sporosarcina sp. ANT_H38]|uniref:S1C family serine protease n=1 Tax=Sporosarcina sp. ANT_H38 TaxID=2597358 RepID=UPI0011F2A237|nr:trypsin-like peptidase domain-containing protein [Sporosarcina sp. ANT_H38]KAA0948820.1 PDZ domain-containing protein [Sporosarcina sp. ANT_H38]
MDEFKQNQANGELQPPAPVTESTPRHSQRPPKRRGGFMSGFIGVVIGALLVWFIMQGDNNTKEQSLVNGAEQKDDIVQTERISLDVNTDVTDIVEKVADSVVGVTNLKTISDPWSPEETTRETGSGSGVIYKKQGDKAYIVTNHHVVEGAQELEITFDDGSKTAGKIVGGDMWTDLAVIEIDAKVVKTVIDFGDSDALKRGETVMAIGNPLGLGFSGSVTVGVVSGKDRSIPIDFDENGTVDWFADVLQTDAAINPGNSGGALINLAGQLIGINSMKISEATVEGIGLAIPINLAIPIIDQLEKHGEVNRPTMGVTLLDLRSIPAQQQREMLKLPANVTEGVVINEVMSNSPAQLADVKQYDVIVEMDGEKIGDMVSLRKHLYNSKQVGDTMQMKVYRDGRLIDIEMVLKDGNSF